jgi:predicted kinase
MACVYLMRKSSARSLILLAEKYQYIIRHIVLDVKEIE